LAVLTAEEDAALSMSPGSRLMLFVSLADFADDDDGDGDWLDAGELRLEGPGAQVELYRK
jgi:hypothetical protein